MRSLKVREVERERERFGGKGTSGLGEILTISRQKIQSSKQRTQENHDIVLSSNTKLHVHERMKCDSPIAACASVVIGIAPSERKFTFLVHTCTV